MKVRLVRLVILYLVVCVGVLESSPAPALSKKAIEQTSGMLKNTCKNKSGVKQEVLNQVKAGDFPTDDRKLKCYLHCILQTFQVMKKDQLLVESAVKKINSMLPDTDNMRERTIKQIEACKDSTGEDGCEIAFNVAKCFYEVDPGNNLVPT